MARALAPAAAIGLVAFVVAGWWYVGKLLGTGALTGANDMIRLQESGDFGALLARNFEIDDFAKRALQIYLSFLWGGTWSFARIPFGFLVLLGLCFAIPFGAYFRELAKKNLWLQIEGAPLFIIAPIVAGLLYHVLTQLALGGGAGTPGWYLHIFSAPIGLAFALGVLALWRAKTGRIALIAGGAYTAVFIAAASFLQLSLFSGCAAKNADSGYYQPAECFGDIVETWRRLELLANPTAGLAALLLAASAAAAALALLKRESRRG